MLSIEVRFCPLFSGSSGNAVYVGAGDTHILIDAGLAGRSIEGALASIDVSPSALSAVLITHEHSDHIKGVGVLARRHHVPIYANAGTWGAMAAKLGDVPAPLRREFEGEQDFYVGGFSVQPYAIPHDAADPVGYCLYAGDKKVSVATDLGHVNRRILERLMGSDVLLLEANHDVEMLEANPNYPSSLKRRIRGSRGHLSNEQCAEVLHDLILEGLRHVYLGHLSDQNNAPDIAYDAVTAYLGERGMLVGEDLMIGMTWQDRQADLLTVV